MTRPQNNTPRRLNRRAILAAAAAAAVPVPALATPDDPVVAAIAARKATVAACNACNSEDEALIDALSAADAEAIRAMLRTPPATLPGVKALLRYVTECEEAGDTILETYMEDDEEVGAFERTMGGEVFLRTLLTAMEGL